MRVDMVGRVKRDMSHLFFKNGSVKKTRPGSFRCECGNVFSSLTTTFRSEGIVLGKPLCNECGEVAKDNEEYIVWERLRDGQLEQEDYILNTVKEKGSIYKEEMYNLIENEFGNKTRALGYLVYYGYLRVDKEENKQDVKYKYSVIEDKNLQERYKKAV